MVVPAAPPAAATRGSDEASRAEDLRVREELGVEVYRIKVGVHLYVATWDSIASEGGVMSRAVRPTDGNCNESGEKALVVPGTLGGEC